MAGHPNNIRELAEAKGTIREPTALQVRQYFQATAKEMQRMRREARKAVAGEKAADAAGPPGAGDGPDEPGGEVPDEVDEVADADPKAADATRRRDAMRISKLCSGDPSTEILLALPMRVYLKFGEWLLGEITDPEAVTGAGSPHLRMIAVTSRRLILHLARRHLHYSTAEWDSLEWWEKRNHIEGFEAEGLIELPATGEELAAEAGITQRTADTGAGVIDLLAMRAALTGG